MNKKCSIIIPIRSKKILDENLTRLKRILSVVPHDFEIVVIDDGSSKKVSQYLKELSFGGFGGSGFRYIYLATRWRRFSLARARNAGAREASSDVIFFHDVDFLGSQQVYNSIIQEIETQNIIARPDVFFCVPVGFLTTEGSAIYLEDMKNNHNDDFWSLKNYSKDSCEYLKFLVLGSSGIVCNRQHFLKIGGHDERYDGHGAEDFELLHRLSNIYPIAQKPIDYSVNMGSGTIKEYKGFRAYFALYGQSCKNKGIALVHLYHPKRKTWGYYQSRRNFEMLKSLMENGSHDQSKLTSNQNCISYPLS
jgi:predicted glycosyltransferase involved in capsule biosynthesis